LPAPGTFDLVRVSEQVDYSIYSGADWVLALGAVEPPTPEDTQGGRLVDDLILTLGSSTATSATGLFTANDSGLKIATESGEGIDDGTTMTFVDDDTIHLSSPATADGVFVATIRSLNLSNYSAHKAQVRRAQLQRTAARSFLLEINVDDTRADVGWYLLSIAAAESEVRGEVNGEWDWRVDGPTGRAFWMRGAAHIRENVTVDG
jgi:hypothetical protein